MLLRKYSPIGLELGRKGVAAEAGKAAFSLAVPLGSSIRGWGMDS